MSRHINACCAAIVAIAVGATVAMADERLFTYSYEPKVLPEGHVEYEQWTTLRHGRPGLIYNRWDVRHELEVGLTDRLTTAVYLNERFIRSQSPTATTRTVQFDGVSSEWKWKLADATADAVGVLLYGEARIVGHEYELEEKVVLGKAIGPWVLAYNLVLEQELVEEFEAGTAEKEMETELVLGNTMGVSRRLGPSLAVGLEAWQRAEFEKGDTVSDVYFAGPNLHVAKGRFWATGTLASQVRGFPNTSGGRNLQDRESWEARIVFGASF